MPDPQWGARPAPPPVSIGRKPKKTTPPPPTPAPAPLPPRTQALNSQFGSLPSAQSAVVSPPEFTADLPDPSVVGLNTGPVAPQRRPVTISPPVAPAAVQTNTPGTSLPPDLGVNGPAPPMPEQAVDPHAGESPSDRMVREAGERYSSAMSEQPKKRKGVGGRILSGLESFVIEGGRPFRSQMPRNSQELAYGLARGAGGAAYGAVNTEYPSRVRIEAKRQQAGSEYDAALKRQSEETQNRLRDAQTDYTAGRGPREDLKLGLQSRYNNWRMTNGDARLSETENYHTFLLAERQAGRLSTEQYQQALIGESQANRGEKTREFNVMNDRWQKKFDADQRQRDFDNRIKERRAAAYEKAVQSGGGSSGAKRATAAAEVDAYEENIAELQSDLYELEQTPEAERGSDYSRGLASLKRQLRDQTLKSEKARAAAGQQTKASVTREQLKAVGDEAEVRRIATENGKNPDAYVRLWKDIRGDQKK